MKSTNPRGSVESVSLLLLFIVLLGMLSAFTGVVSAGPIHTAISLLNVLLALVVGVGLFLFVTDAVRKTFDQPE